MIRLLLLILSVAILSADSQDTLSKEENEQNEKFRTLKTDIQLSPSETQELLEILKGKHISPTSNKKKRKLVANDPEPVTVSSDKITSQETKRPLLGPGIVVEDETKNLPILEPINELMEPSFTTTVSIPIPETTKNFETEILLPADQEPATVINPPPKKLKLRKIAVNTRESHFFKLRSDDSKKVKRRLIKEQQKFGEDFQETFKSLKEEQKNGTKREGVVKPRKEKKPILSGETNATIHTPAKAILPPLLRKPLPISPIIEKEPLLSLILIRNGRVLSLSKKQQHHVDMILRTLLSGEEMIKGEKF